jgi:hypothetical protein
VALVTRPPPRSPSQRPMEGKWNPGGLSKKAGAGNRAKLVFSGTEFHPGTKLSASVIRRGAVRVIDSELRLLLAIRRLVCEEEGRPPSTARIDALLDERSETMTVAGV